MAEGDYPLAHQGKFQHTMTKLWGGRNYRPCPHLSPSASPERKIVQLLLKRLVPEPLLCIKVKLTISSKNFPTLRNTSSSFPIKEVTFHDPRASF